MATKLVNWTSKDGQIIKSRLSEGRRAKFLPSVVWFAYDCHGIESYLGNVGLKGKEGGLDVLVFRFIQKVPTLT